MVLTNDPRPANEYYKTYTVDYLNNMDNCKPVTYLNVPIEQLKMYTKKSIEDDKVYRTVGVILPLSLELSTNYITFRLELSAITVYFVCVFFNCAL